MTPLDFSAYYSNDDIICNTKVKRIQNQQNCSRQSQIYVNMSAIMGYVFTRGITVNSILSLAKSKIFETC